MYERFIFTTKIEMEGTRQLIKDAFPLAKLWDVYDPDDFILDMELVAIERCQFFRWATSTCGVFNFCFNMVLNLLDDPRPDWLIAELRNLQPRLPK